jgi:hypothetical protein
VDAAAKAGANMIVSGSGVFKADDMALNISTMKRSIEAHGNGMEESALSPLRRDENSSCSDVKSVAATAAEGSKD